MKEQIIRHKAKLIAAVLVIAVLTGAFIWGGSYPKTDADTVYAAAGDPASPSSSAPAEAAGSSGAPAISPDPTVRGGAAETPGAAEEQAGTPAPETASGPAAPPASKPESEDSSDSVHDNTSETREMAIDPETGKDQYMTDPVPEGKPLPVESQNADITGTQFTCSLSVSCGAILDNMELLDEEKWELVPEDGVILKETAVTFYEGESVFNVLQREMKKAGIHMEYTNTPMYNSAYIEAINNLYEFDVGELSGWMYKVNSWFPNYGCSRYQLKDGDIIEWVYTCDLGKDVGGYYSVGS